MDKQAKIKETEQEIAQLRDNLSDPYLKTMEAKRLRKRLDNLHALLLWLKSTMSSKLDC